MKANVISIIVPCYNEASSLDAFIQEIFHTQASLPDVFLEILFVNDGSADDTLVKLKDLVKQYPERVHYLSFSRNFGKEAAILAGLDHAEGEWVAIMDVDLQDPPHLLVEMFRLVKEEGHDVAAAIRSNREGEPRIRSFFATQFYKLYNRIAQVKLVEGARDYRLMNRQVVEAVRRLPERNRFSKGLFSWVGFDTAYVPYPHAPRLAGESSWSFINLVDYAIDGIISFSDRPLTLASFIGFVSFILALIIGLVIVIRTLLFGDPTPGWPSLAVLVIGMGGLQLLSLGIIGKCIAKMYLESKHRPHYLIKEQSLSNSDKQVDHPHHVS